MDETQVANREPSRSYAWAYVGGSVFGAVGSLWLVLRGAFTDFDKPLDMVAYVVVPAPFAVGLVWLFGAIISGHARWHVGTFVASLVWATVGAALLIAAIFWKLALEGPPHT